MKNIIFFLILSLINYSLTKMHKNQSNLNKNHAIKNKGYRTILIRTELNATELEKLLNNNQTLISNKTIISEINDEYDNDTFYDDIDIEIEDEIEDNKTMPNLIDYKVKESKTSNYNSLLALNEEKYLNMGKYRKILLFLSLMMFIYVIICLNTLKKKKNVLKTYQLFELDFKQENLIIKND